MSPEFMIYVGVSSCRIRAGHELIAGRKNRFGACGGSTVCLDFIKGMCTL